MKTEAKVWDAGDGCVVFECPGCGYGHNVHTKTPNERGAVWTFNGNYNSPTFSPSIFVNPNGDPDYPKCHSHVTDGKIKFGHDCTHALAGQTVDLPFIEDDG